nr:putative ribonuclease H-like domain-containing protein [Tanacetum cinerariifolium]
MEEEEVSLVDGVFEGALRVLEDEEDGEVNLIWQKSDIFAFDDAVRVNTLELKKLMTFFKSRKFTVIWSFGLLRLCKSTKIPFISEEGLAIDWNSKNLTELLKRESDEFVLNLEGDKNDSRVISLKELSTAKQKLMLLDSAAEGSLMPLSQVNAANVILMLSRQLILNGDSLVPTRVVEGVLQPVAPRTAEHRLAQKNELKARGTLLMAFPKKHPLKFNSYKYAKTLMEAIEKRFGGNIKTKKIDVDDLEEMDLRWQMAMLTMRARRFLQKIGRNLGANGPTSMGFDMSKVECYNCHRKAHFSRECKSPKASRRTGAVEPQRRTVLVETSTLNALVSQCDGTRSYNWSYQAEEEPTNSTLMAFSSSSYSNNEVSSCSKACSKAYAQLHTQYDKLTDELRKSQFDVISYQTGLEFVEARLLAYTPNDWPPSSLYDRFQPSGRYHVVPPPYTGTFMPPKPDLVFNTAPTAVETDHLAFNVSDFEDESETKAPQFVPSFVQSSEQVKSPRHSVQPIETSIPAATPAPASPKPTSSGKRRNKKACFVCKSVDHLIKDCDYYAKKMAQPIQRNYAHRGNHKQYASMTHKKPQKHMVPTAVLTQSKPVFNTTVRPVSAVVPKIMVTQPRFAHPIVTKSKSPIRRHITRSPSPQTSNLPPRVTAAQALVVSVAQGKFEGKIDEEFLVGYSINSKAFIVFNSRTRIVQETLHVNFLENKPNVTGSGPTWLFDIDSLTRVMNYQPVNAGNQTNPSAGFQDKFDVEKAWEEIDQQYVLFPMWSSGSTNPQNYDGDAAFDEKEHDCDAKKPESEVILSPSSSAQSMKQDDKIKKEAKGKIPTVGQNSLNNANTFSVVGPLNTAVSPTYRKYSFIDASQLPDDLDMPELEDITYSDDEDGVVAEADFNNLEISIIVSPIPTTRIHKDHLVSQIIGDLSSTTQTRKEPKRVHQALKDPSWIEAMQEELLARIEAIRLFLAYASFMGFMVYQMDVKSAFLYGTIEKEVYVSQPLGFEDPDHPDKVYKVVKALYCLHQASRACTPIDTEKPLLKDPDGEDIDVHTYSAVSIKLDITSTSSDSPLLRVNTPRSDEDRLEIMGLTVFLLPKIKSVGIGVNTVGLKVSAVSHKLLMFSLTNWCCSLSVVREAAIKEVLRLDDAEGVDCLPNEELFVELARIGYEKPSTKLTFYKAFFSIQWKFLIHTILRSMSAKRTLWNEFSSAMTYVVICLPIGRKFNFSKYIFESLNKRLRKEEMQKNMFKMLVMMMLLKEMILLLMEKFQLSLKNHPYHLLPYLPQPPKDLPSTSQVRIINKLDKVDVVALMDDKKEDKKEEEAKEDEPAEVQEVVDVVTTTKLITEVVTTASETVIAVSIIISAAEPQVPAAIITAAPIRVVTKEQIEEEESRALQSINETSAQKAAQRRKLNKEVEDLKRHLAIVPDEDDDIYTEATPLARKNFDREDLEALWNLIKERFSTSKPKNFFDDFLLTTLGAMFEKPDAQA